MSFTAIVFVIFLCALAACASPESGRQRGGSGADVGNRTRVVRMHEGSDPFYKTPKLIAGQSAPLASARQADKLSR